MHLGVPSPEAPNFSDHRQGVVGVLGQQPRSIEGLQEEMQWRGEGKIQKKGGVQWVQGGSSLREGMRWGGSRWEE